MHLGGTCRTAAAVSSGTSAQKDNNISRIRRLTDHCTPWSRPQYCSDLHALCHIIRMVDLFYIPRRQTNLVAVGAVPAGCSPHQFLLRQFSLQGFLHGNGGICRASYPHSLIDIGTPGQGIPDSSAQTGGSAAKRLYFRRVVVGLIFKVHQPLLRLSVYLYRHHNGAGIDLIRLLLIGKPAFCFQLPHGHQRQIHQAHKLVPAPLENLCTVRQILPVGILHRFPVIPFTKGYICKLRGKCGMTAVIRPVSIQYPDFCHRRISVLLLPEIILNM